MEQEVDKGNLEELNLLQKISRRMNKNKSSWQTCRCRFKRHVATRPNQHWKKEPADINKLADEYLRLNYHGIRAKEKEFNATLKTDFDESINKINIIP